MSKKKSIYLQIEELETEHKRLKIYEKCFEILLDAEFGMTRKELHKILSNQSKNPSDKQGSSESVSNGKTDPDDRG